MKSMRREKGLACEGVEGGPCRDQPLQQPGREAAVDSIRKRVRILSAGNEALCPL